MVYTQISQRFKGYQTRVFMALCTLSHFVNCYQIHVIIDSLTFCFLTETVFWEVSYCCFSPSAAEPGHLSETWRWSGHYRPHRHAEYSEYRHYTTLYGVCNARNCVVVEDEYHFLLIFDFYKLLRHKYVTKQLPPYDKTQNGFQIFINLMKTIHTDAMRDEACFIYHAMNVRKRLIANSI